MNGSVVCIEQFALSLMAEKMSFKIIKLMRQSCQPKTTLFERSKSRVFGAILRTHYRPTAEGFFAHPYHSWEWGLTENTNGLIRQYIPKGKDIDDLSDEDVAKIIGKINSRPRKCLGFKTPNQLFLGLKQHVALAS